MKDGSSALVLVTLQRVEVGYHWPLLPPVSLSVRAGDRVALLGPNGAGKTTLLRTLLGLLPPLAGRVAWPLGRRPRIGYLPQAFRLDPVWPLSVRQVVLMGRYPALGVGCRARAADHEAVDRQLERVGLAERGAQSFRSLSGGECQRALLARALVGEPELLVLDEPTSQMDPAAEHALLEQVAALAGAGGTAVLFVTHQLAAAARFAETVVLVDPQAGRVEAGPAEAVLTAEALTRLYGAPIALRREAGTLFVGMAPPAGGRAP